MALRQYLGGLPAGDSKSFLEGESEGHIQHPSHEEMRLEEVKSPTCPGKADKDQSRGTCCQTVLEHECRPAFYPGCLFHDVLEGIAQANHSLIQVVVYLLAFHIISQNMY